MNEETDWNKKYRALAPGFSDPPREWLVDHKPLLPEGGLVLEAAMGLGANIPFLMENGLRVLAVDRSFESVKHVKKKYPAALVLQADLSQFWWPEGSFELVCNFYYLERSLMEQFKRILKPGGLVIFETFTIQMLQLKSSKNPDRYLKPGELAEYFKSWQILDYREGWIHSIHGGEKAVASIVAKKQLE